MKTGGKAEKIGWNQKRVIVGYVNYFGFDSCLSRIIFHIPIPSASPTKCQMQRTGQMQLAAHGSLLFRFPKKFLIPSRLQVPGPQVQSYRYVCKAEMQAIRARSCPVSPLLLCFSHIFAPDQIDVLRLELSSSQTKPEIHKAANKTSSKRHVQETLPIRPRDVSW
jgi:hypothetical protein